MTNTNLGTIAGTTGGTLTAILGYKTSGSLTEMILVTGYGAVFSFTVTELLKWLWKILKEIIKSKKQKHE